MTEEEKKKRESPATTSSAYDIMRPRWDQMTAVLGGTEAMRAAGTKYLPQHPEEEGDRYAERLGTATLLNLTELTLESLVGRPFSDPVQLSDDMPAKIKEYMEDVDLQGNNIDVFGRTWFREGLAKGFAFALIEFPIKEPRADGTPRTLADDRKEGLRPYWVFLKPENVIFVRMEVIQGRHIITHARIVEEVTEMDGFMEVVKKQIRILEPGRQEIWIPDPQDTKGKKWKRESEIKVDLDFVPLAVFYAAKENDMQAKPPLLDQSYLNIAHWQSGSDQRAILTVARFPILALSGSSDEERLKVGPNHWLYTSDPTGKFYYVEHNGRAIKAGKDDLDDLIAQMSHYGGEFLKKQPGRQTATARALDSAEATSPLQDMTLRFMDAMDHALWMTAQWLKLDYGGKVTISTDFGPEKSDQNDLLTLQFTRKIRDISRKWYLGELKRRGLLGDEFDADKDLDQIQDEMLLGISRVDLDNKATDDSTPGGPR